MNASTQALSVDMVHKIACIPVLLRTEFPSARVDFSPWVMDERTQRLHDPDSIDFGFSFPGWHPQLNCGCILLQVYVSQSNTESDGGLYGIGASGHGMQKQFWQISGSTDWKFCGTQPPSDLCQIKLKHVFEKICTLFDYPALLSHTDG